MFKALTPNPQFAVTIHELELRHLADDSYILDKTAYMQITLAGHEEWMAIDRRFVTDLASIPYWAQWAMPKNHHDYRLAALAHDWLYSHHDECYEVALSYNMEDSRLFADRIMLALMNRKSWRVPLIYWYVRAFGKRGWNKYN